MPRNDQITRQWHLLRHLESSKGATLEELVHSVPDDYPKNSRTIRRDLEALEAVGFPLVTEHVNGQTRWRLIEGFRDIPALGFSATELMALTFSRKLLSPLEGTEIQSALNSALNKVASALPPQGHQYVRALDNLFSIGLGPHKNYQQYTQTVDLITQVIDKARTAQMRYFSASRSLTSRREVDPYRLWYAAGGLYLIAYCHLRKDVRLFAVERIRSITLTDHPYQMPLGFDVEEYVQDALVVMRGRRIDVELLFSKEAAGWVKDKLWHSSQQTTGLKDGRLRMMARRKMARRGIPESWVNEGLRSPDQVVEGHGGRLVAQQRRRIRRREKLLRVVFEETEDKYVVITTYLTSDIKRYWKDTTP